MAEFLLIPALLMGAVIGFIELIFVHADEQGLGWLSHGIHALPVAMILTFIAMNIDFAASLVDYELMDAPLWIHIGIGALVGLVAAIKVKGAAAVVKGHNSVGEKLGHALIIGALVAASPYIWMLLAPIVPSWLGGGASAGSATR